jgi:hypothetical protein
VSRPSRGFTGTPVPSTVIETCPSAGSLGVTALDKHDWITITDWVPSVEVGTINLMASLNGGTPFSIAADGHVMSNWAAEFDPFTYGGAGDVLQLWTECTGVTGCPNFTSNIVVMVIES